MSTLQLAHQQSVILPQKFPSRAGTSLKRTPRTDRTKISQLYERSATEIPTHRTSTSSKLDPIDDEILSLDLINQYNEIVGPKESLAFKRLPPVKVSYQSATNNKNKFVESPRVEGQSRIIRPHLSMKTYSPGHHIFTEGISKSSITRSPTFSLHQVGVPYSNLPDNISIYKEKDKFAFGVKDDECEKSPYRLTPTPLKLGNATLMSALEPDIDKIPRNQMDVMSKSKRGSKSNPGRRSLEIKSNVIKLEPLVNMEDKDSKYDYKNKTEFNTDIVKIPSGFTRPSRSPLAPSNSFYQGDYDVETKTSIKSSEICEKREEKSITKTETPKRKLSIVSIGETVGPSFYDSKKRETRQQYPMYDHTSKKNETLKRQKFEYSENSIFQAKSNVPPSTFTYKVSTHGLAFAQENPAEKFKPIKNNLYDRHGNVIHKQRGLGRYRPSDHNDDFVNGSSDYNFRRYYKRVFRRPKSSESQGTDFSQLPGNPPPSEISHIFSEDGPLLVNDVRNGMLTLVEERTMTAASLISPLKDNTSVGEGKETSRTNKDASEKPGSKLTNLEDTETCTDTDVQFENALRTVERQQEQEIETARTTETDKKSEFETAVNAVEKIKDMERIKSATENSSKGDGSVVEQYIAEAEERIKHLSIVEETEHQIVQIPNADSISDFKKGIKSVTFDESQSAGKKKFQSKVKTSANKQYRPVPKLCLDSLDTNHSLQLSKERTSLSRSIQNMTLSEEKRRDFTKPPSNIDLPDIHNGNENKTRLPVTMLRLFSDSSTISNRTESVDLDMIEDGEELFEVHANELDDSKTADKPKKGKKVLNNANVPFIYPSTNKGKAKRQ